MCMYICVCVYKDRCTHIHTGVYAVKAFFLNQKGKASELVKNENQDVFIFHKLCPSKL